MTDAQRTWQAGDHRRMAWRYELVGLNGSLLPLEVDDGGPEECPDIRAFLDEAELHLAPDCTGVYVRRGASGPWSRPSHPDEPRNGRICPESCECRRVRPLRHVPL